MDRKLGSIKAQMLREKDFVPWQKCSFSGSDHEDYREYIVPIVWQRMTDADWRHFKIQVEGEATEEDLLNVRSTASDSGLAAQIAALRVEDPDAQPTVEIDDAAAKIKEIEDEIEKLKENKADEIAKLQQWELAARMLKKSYENADKDTQEVAEALSKSLDSHIKKLGKAVNVLNKLCVEEADESKLPVFLKELEALENDEANIQKWAAMFGLDAKQKKTTLEQQIIWCFHSAVSK